MESLQTNLQAFFSTYKLRTYRKRDLILHEDDTPNGVYYIKSGYVRLYSVSEDGRELTRLLLGPNDLFPIRWVFSDEPIDYYVEPITDVEAWHAPKEAFLNFLEQQPELLMNVIHMIVSRMGRLYKRMEYFAFGDAYQKVATMLVIQAHNFGKEINGKIVIDIPLTHQDIASLIGVARETASVEIERLKREKIIDYSEHKIIINSIQKLEEESKLTSND